MPNLHPVLVHFPIALLTVSFIADFLAVVLKNSELGRVGWWTQVAGTLGLAGTIVSGLIAGTDLAVPGEAKGVFEAHQQAAFAVAALFAALMFWRAGNRSALPVKPQWLYLGLCCLGVILLFWGAWHGGELVYRFGVGTVAKP